MQHLTSWHHFFDRSRENLQRNAQKRRVTLERQNGNRVAWHHIPAVTLFFGGITWEHRPTWAAIIWECGGMMEIIHTFCILLLLSHTLPAFASWLHQPFLRSSNDAGDSELRHAPARGRHRWDPLVNALRLCCNFYCMSLYDPPFHFHY